MGDARHQIGAGLLIAGVFLLFLQQMPPHMLEGGVYRGELVRPLAVQGGGQVPTLHPAGRLNDGVHRLENPPDLVLGKQKAEDADDCDGRQADDREGDEGRLILGALLSEHLRGLGFHHGHQDRVPAPPPHDDDPLVLEGQGAGLRPGGVGEGAVVEVLLKPVERGVDHLVVLFHRQAVVQLGQTLVQLPPVSGLLRPAGQSALHLVGAAVRRRDRLVLIGAEYQMEHTAAHGEKGQQGQDQGHHMEEENLPSHLHPPSSICHPA